MPHWTPGKYSHLTDEQFAKLAELSAKALNPAVPGTTQDGPQINQACYHDCRSPFSLRPPRLVVGVANAVEKAKFLVSMLEAKG